MAASREPSLKATDAAAAIRLPVPTNNELHRPNGAASALSSIRQTHKSLRTAYRESLHELIAQAAAVGLFLQGELEHWEAFCGDPFWHDLKTRPTTADRQDAVCFAMQFAFGGATRAASKRASKYYRAIAPLIERKIPPAALSAEIRKAGGIEKLARANVRKPKARKVDRRDADRKPESPIEVSADFSRCLLSLAEMRSSKWVQLLARQTGSTEDSIRLEIECVLEAD